MIHFYLKFPQFKMIYFGKVSIMRLILVYRKFKNSLIVTKSKSVGKKKIFSLETFLLLM